MDKRILKLTFSIIITAGILCLGSFAQAEGEEFIVGGTGSRYTTSSYSSLSSAIRIDNDIILHEFQQYIRMYADSTQRAVILEWTGSGEPSNTTDWQVVFDRDLGAKPVGVGAQWYSSGQINVNLYAGNWYVCSIYIPTGVNRTWYRSSSGEYNEFSWGLARANYIRDNQYSPTGTLHAVKMADSRLMHMKYFVGSANVPTTPEISYSPASFSFVSVEGGANPNEQALEISNSGIGELNWEVNSNADWLTLNPATGVTTSEVDAVTLTVDASGLSVGTYSAAITIDAPGASNTPQNISVNLTIDPANTAGQEYTVGNTGSRYTTSSFTSLSSAIRVDSNITLHEFKQYIRMYTDSTQRAVILKWTGAGEPSNATDWQVVLDRDLGAKSADVGAQWYSSGQINVNLYAGNWYVCSIYIPTGTARTWYRSSFREYNEFSWGLARANYIRDNQYPPGGRLNAVKMTDARLMHMKYFISSGSLPLSSEIGHSPESLEFTGFEGGLNPDAQVLELFNSGAGIMNWEVSSDVDWLVLDPTNGITTNEIDTVVVSTDITGLSSGAHNATITITAAGASNTPQTIPVSLILDPVIYIGLDNWHARTDTADWNDSRGIAAVEKDAANDELILHTDFTWEPYYQGKGEVYIYTGDIPDLGQDMSARSLIMEVFIPVGFIADPSSPEHLRLFFKSADNWESTYGIWKKLDYNAEGTWVTVEFDPMSDPAAWKNAAFDPTRVWELGLSITKGSGQYCDSGIRIRNARIIETNQVFPEVPVPTSTPPLDIAEFINSSGRNLRWDEFNYGWCVGRFPSIWGTGTDGGFSNPAIKANFESDLLILKQQGISTIRIMSLFADLRTAILQDAQGNFILDGSGSLQFDDKVYDDVKAFIDALKNTEMNAVVCLFDFRVADDIEIEGPRGGTWLVGEHPEIFTNSSIQDSFMNLFSEFFNRIYAETDGINDVVLFWEVMNEPEACCAVKFDQVKAFHQRFFELMRANMSGAVITTGSLTIDSAFTFWKNDVDVIAIHRYPGIEEVDLLDPVGNYGFGSKPVFWTEFGDPNTTISEVLDRVHSSGYNGILFWDDSNFLFSEDEYHEWVLEKTGEYYWGGSLSEMVITAGYFATVSVCNDIAKVAHPNMGPAYANDPEYYDFYSLDLITGVLTKRSWVYNQFIGPMGTTTEYVPTDVSNYVSCLSEMLAKVNYVFDSTSDSAEKALLQLLIDYLIFVQSQL